ncbi:AAA family ATPase [Hugenholtzia roseola]|uniref:AAA family ATPase n=1 Tax=Hugenholtzia roseola TaxID=1002 RepID=UPI00047E3906|nr:ATP-binding protein [Hugenholtzia roseola]
MVVQFKVGNYLSFKEVAVFSMVGYMPIKEHETSPFLSNVFYDPSEKIKLLKSSVLYGANGSGKSNLLSAMHFFRKFILTSSNQRQAGDQIKVLPFLLSSETEGLPSFFEMIFYIEDTRYRFGFETDNQNIHAEWLFALGKESSTKELKLFSRQFQQIQPTKHFKEGKGLEDKTRPNALFLSTVAQLNGNIATKILRWFQENFNVISGLENTTISYTVSKFQEDEDFRKIVIEFFKSIQIGFEELAILEEEALLDTTLAALPKVLPQEMDTILTQLKKLQETLRVAQEGKSEAKKVAIYTQHKKFDKAENFLRYETLDFNLESKGTQKIFSLLGPIFDTIQKGKVLVVDELDSRLHTLLTKELVKFFHLKINKKAQLIFASHDTNLLRKDIFRRDQIWFAEKNKLGATDLYSLVEYKVNQATVRNDASFEKDYLLGKYGAIPFLGNIQKFKTDFFDDPQEQEK